MVWPTPSRPRRHFPCYSLLPQSVSSIVNALNFNILLSLGFQIPGFSSLVEEGSVPPNSAKETPFLPSHVH